MVNGTLVSVVNCASLDTGTSKCTWIGTLDVSVDTGSMTTGYLRSEHSRVIGKLFVPNEET